ncbi:unnamed protein product [Chrysoparadoxa australica]
MTPSVSLRFTPQPLIQAANGVKPAFSMGTVDTRGLRSACDFCHNKRIKCKRVEGSAKCYQCVVRDQDCHYSPKEKTGPKPKGVANSRSPSPARRTAAAQHNGSGHQSKRVAKTRTAYRPPRTSDQYIRKASHSNVFGESGTAPSTPSHSPKHIESSSAYKQELHQRELAMTAEEVLAREGRFLSSYQLTVGRLLPLVLYHVLDKAMEERVVAASIPGGKVKSSTGQAELSAALAIGALIHNSPSAEFYHAETRTFLKSLYSHPSPQASPALCMLATFWMYKGEESRKTVYLEHSRLGLKDVAAWPLNMLLTFEHLDCNERAELRADVASLSPCSRALHVVSCVLRAMQELMDAKRSPDKTIALASQLQDCYVALQAEQHTGLPSLLCMSLQAFLLFILGRSADAAQALSYVPDMIEGNPEIMKALPLSWDATLIAGSISFLLGCSPTFSRIYHALEPVQNSTAATKWQCHLPRPDSPREMFLHHACMSSSNICDIVCEVGQKTKCGTVCYYDNEQRTGHDATFENSSSSMFHTTHIPPEAAFSITSLPQTPPRRRRKSGDMNSSIGGSDVGGGGNIVQRSEDAGSPLHYMQKRRKSLSSESPLLDDTSKARACSASPSRPVASLNSSPLGLTLEASGAPCGADGAALSQQALSQQLLEFSLSQGTEGTTWATDNIGELGAAGGLGEVAEETGGTHQHSASGLSDGVFQMLDETDLVGLLADWDSAGLEDEVTGWSNMPPPPSLPADNPGY